MCKHRVRFVQYVGERNGKASSRKHWKGYDVRIRSTSLAVFFLKLSCLSGCFDRILLLSASSGYHTLSEGTLRIPNRRRSRYPHAGRQNAVYCQTLERLLIIKERKNTAGRSAGFLHTSVPVLLGRSFLIQFPTCTTLPAIHHPQKGVHYALGHTYAHCFFYRQ